MRATSQEEKTILMNVWTILREMDIIFHEKVWNYIQ